MARRTYGRIYAPTIETAERPVKRRRVETTLSSEASSPCEDSANLFEPKEVDENSCSSTKDIRLVQSPQQSTSDPTQIFPSSPPQIRTQPFTIKSRKPIFSFLRHEKSSSSSTLSGKSGKMKQLTLDVGRPPTKSCAECGMTFTPSEKRDVALHIGFHAQKVGKAHKLSLRFLQSIDRNVVWADVGNGEKIIRITRRDEAHKRKAVEQILDVVAGDLGSIPLAPSLLWSQESRNDSKYDKFQTFLFLKDQLCIGLLLAERIDKARRVQEGLETDNNPHTDARILASNELFSATMGISRIWTSSSFRRSGIASKMLNAACENFQPLMPVKKGLIAFSQPTDMGARLARKWFSRKTGWLVYDG